ncbi:TetR/AcrR family transcriptional regulator [Actinomadura algeriensis]|uniref:AcrR family transcriptional regulator n=1 Tax=Actinomadura algeriensis TaxID=1679523 RepID=A0ABR9JR59_9ACTN|nr:TetR/AcrR family transcriptional regulator [Actinomadura algeriensis]MBE1533047.1 AcrR family transcriptional regulator [Actinomadura algeriensis]
MERRTRGPGVRHEERRNEIADAVLTIVAERGLAAVSLTEVAARADVSPGRVQHYFPAKQRLIEAAFDRGNALSTARIRARVGRDLAGAPPRDVLTAVLTELIAHDAETRAHMRVRQSFTALALADEAIAARMRDEYARFHGEIADVLRRGGAADPETTAVDLIAHAEGLAYYVLIGITDPGTARTSIERAIAAVYG